MDEAREERLAAILQLTLTPGVGPRIYQLLVEHFGSPEQAAKSAPSELRKVPGLGPKLVRAMVAARQTLDIPGELQLCRTAGLKLLVATDAEYPRLLREIHDPPAVLYVRGELLPMDTLAIAIVGTRHASAYGLRQAERLASGLARAGLTIVSGLARGIDAAAHRGALAAGGRTVAVLGCGVLEVYPPEHADLANAITRCGALSARRRRSADRTAACFPSAIG
jgi:DNA processing protein